MAAGRRMWRTKGNAQDEVLLWGVPGRLDTELTLLALSFLLTPSLRPSVFLGVFCGFFPSLKWPV